MSTRHPRHNTKRTPTLLQLSHRPVPHLVEAQRAKMFARADEWAAEILRATVTNAKGIRMEDVDEALAQLTRRSSYYKEADEQRQDDASLMIACQEAGLMLGLAFGLRLRGAA